MSPAVSELTAHLGYWLRQVSNHVSHSFARMLAAKEVTVAEWALMRMLYGQDPLSPGRLAARMGLTPGAVTKLADRLIAKNLVARRPSLDDRRAQTLSLTARGAEFVPQLAALADRNDAACFAHLSREERRALELILKDTVARLGLTATPVD
ncbi:MarR family winged helix-turn-helix transcriptional regulator [Paramagnetospirillum magneticum]|uniref:Transcriptional regulator n=1 Tax=Paramagnetospirillum magneticum (strain ATCC 700264 / AMB-1) TaxID=342108 RepID=Q2W1Q5_PARM1|nr:MarR family transcriptional regulator [Paramagnetospirillum magneticum]BAE52220.1 Transcriptional regulator [Paramagnetospirillum magneticum AMB-1]